MEPATCEKFFAKDKNKVMIRDEDSSSEARVKKIQTQASKSGLMLTMSREH